MNYALLTLTLGTRRGGGPLAVSRSYRGTVASGGELAPPLCIYDPIGADIPNTLRVDRQNVATQREAAQGCSPGRTSSLRRYLQLLPLSPLPASLAFVVATVGSNWTQLLAKLCKVGPKGGGQRLGTGGNSKLHRKPKTHCAVAKLTKAVQNVLKPRNTLQQR